MVSLGMLWLPILAASVLVFIAGFIMNMVMPHHRTDWSKLPDEDAFREALRAQNASQGQYVYPHASTAAEMKDPAYVDKVNAGPNGLLVIGPSSVGPSAKQLGLHFVYIVFITFMVAYIAQAVLPAGVDYLKVFQVTGTAAFLGYSGSLFLNSIWYHMSWAMTFKNFVDGFVYGLLTAGAFGWLWPA